MGITFDDTEAGNATPTGATAAQLNGLGAELSSPVAVGSNTNQYFTTSAANPLFTSNPSGSLAAGGNFAISISTPVPEPGTGMLSLLAALPLAAGLIRRRRAKKG